MSMLYFLIVLDVQWARKMFTGTFLYILRYKWNYSGLSLDKRLDFFQSNWPFFAGFGKNLVRRNVLIFTILTVFTWLFGHTSLSY